jgi:transposase InsO family protein
MRSFLQDMGVETILIEPGAPWQNPFAETFHARLRDELLNQEIFQTLKEADVIINQWRRYYNTERPHGALGMRTPNDALTQVELFSC